MTSKLHWSLHIASNFSNFGPMAFTDTAENESLHKGLKRSYNATNKRKDMLGKELLQVNVPAELLSRIYVDGYRRSRVVMKNTQ